MFAEYRNSPLMDVLKSLGCAPNDMGMVDDEDDDDMDPVAARARSASPSS
jgi:hypothetical protein